MKKYIFPALSVIVAYLLQTSVFPHLQLGHIIPNVMIIVVVFFALMWGQTSGIVIGIICGILLDISGAVCFGLNTLILMYCGSLVGASRDRIYPDDFKVPLFITAVTDFFCGCAVFVVYTLSGHTYSPSYAMNSVIFPEIIYSIVVSLPVYVILLTVQQAMDRHKDKGAIKL